MTLKLFACGDVVNFTGNPDWLSDAIKNIVNDCDFSIANFEAPINSIGMNPISKAGPHIYQSPHSIDFLKQAGFTHVSLANNHIYDYGETAFKNTICKLERNGIEFLGAGTSFEESYRPRILKKDNVKIGLLAACENEFGCHFDDSLLRSGYAWLFHNRLEDEIVKLKAKVDYIVLVAHAGVENIPIPIKEWRDRYKRLCDLGVNVVIGHHPHVPQGYENYGNSFIFYSLGNFYFDTPSFFNKTDDSYSLILNFSKCGSISFDFIFHKKINGTTTLVTQNEVLFELDILNSLLTENYLNLNDHYALDLYNAYYKDYYLFALGIKPGLKEKLKSLLKSTLRMNKKEAAYQGLLLLHNIRIDSHRFIVQRALRLKYEK